MKAKLLFVDDRTKRIQHAPALFQEFDVTIATNVPEALRQMSANDFDVVSLDFDLNGHDFQDPYDPTCGMEIVRYICATGWPPQRRKPIFWIHSSNLFGAHMMVVELTQGEYEAEYKPIVYDEVKPCAS